MPPVYARQALLIADFRSGEMPEYLNASGKMGCLLAEQLDSIDWSWLSMDGCITKSPLAGSKTGRNPTRPGKQGVKAQSDD